SLGVGEAGGLGLGVALSGALDRALSGGAEDRKGGGPVGRGAGVGLGESDGTGSGVDGTGSGVDASDAGTQRGDPWGGPGCREGDWIAEDPGGVGAAGRGDGGVVTGVGSGLADSAGPSGALGCPETRETRMGDQTPVVHSGSLLQHVADGTAQPVRSQRHQVGQAGVVGVVDQAAELMG